MKKQCAGFLCVLTFTTAAFAQSPVASYSAAEAPRTLFPKNWVRGFVDAALAPPHNEPDLNRCHAWAGADGGADAPCSAFARYVASTYIELQPLGRGPLRGVFLFIEPHFYFGKNVPQFQYNYSLVPMAYERQLGIGVELPKNFELRLSQHRVAWLGRYARDLGRADKGQTGPFGLFTTVSARWYFGGYGRRH